MVNSVSNNADIIFQSYTGAARAGDSGFSAVFDGARTSDAQTGLDDIFERAADKYNVPVNLLKAIAKVESNFRADAVSCAGASGIMQLMPATAQSLGVTDPFDPEQSIMGGANYISKMLNMYDGNVRLALAAYNAGCGNVSKYGGIPPFKETQAYVQKVTEAMGGDLAVPYGNCGRPVTVKPASAGGTAGSGGLWDGRIDMLVYSKFFELMMKSGEDDKRIF